MRSLLIWVLMLLSISAFAKPKFDVDEFNGPFSTWLNVKTEFGAVGDGKADDSAALQKAFTACLSKSHVLFLPAGTYRLTKTLELNACGHFNIIGEDPVTTIIKWDGAEGDQEAMFSMNGVYYSKFSRITWDGSGKNITAIYHRWGQDLGGVGTGNEHSDEIFKDVAFGIRAGKPNVHKMDAETSVLRCKFIKNSVAGVRIQSFNALDWFIWDSEFDDCAVGITNDPGAGHFHAYRNIFRRSTIADVALRNASYFGVRYNLSINSRRFFEARNIGGWAVMVTLQGNTVIDPIDPVAFDIRNVGPITLLDNVVKSRPEVKVGPVVIMDGGMEGNYVSVGNTFTVAKPISARDRSIELQTTVIEAEKVVVPELPGAVTPPTIKRQVFEVKAGDDSDKIQSYIDAAMEFKGKRPIIHFPFATYHLAKTLVVPAGLDVQFIGDAGTEGMALNWQGAADGAMIKLVGPTRATFRDLTFTSKSGKGIGMLVTNADQKQARISGDGLSVNGNKIGLLVDKLDNADFSFRTFYHQGNTLSVKVVGSATADAGKPTATRTCLFGGASSNNNFSYDVANGGRLLVTDTWYEGAPPTFLKMAGSGIFTMNGAAIAPGRPGPNAQLDDPNFAGVALENFKGRATFLGISCGTRVVVSGTGEGTNALLLGVHMEGNSDKLFPAPPPLAKMAMLQTTRFAQTATGWETPPCRNVENVGEYTNEWLLQMLEQVRNDTPRPFTAIPTSATDLRFYRTLFAGFENGIKVQPGE